MGYTMRSFAEFSPGIPPIRGRCGHRYFYGNTGNSSIRRIYRRTQKLELYLRGDDRHRLVRLSISLTAHLYDQRKIQRST